MAQPKGDAYRDDWWDQRLKSADTPRKQVVVLQSKIAADISKLPESHRDMANELAAEMLEKILDEIQDVAQKVMWT